MINFSKVKKIIVKQSIIEDSLKLIRYNGIDGSEVFLYWLGRINNECLFVSELYVPIQYCFRTNFGVGVHILKEDIESMNRYIYNNDLVNIVQIHSHPSEAYHSTADDHLSLMTLFGQFSIVIPYFGINTDLKLVDSEMYRLSKKGKWIHQRKKKASKIIQVKYNE